MATNGPAGSGSWLAQRIPENPLLNDPNDPPDPPDPDADEADVDQQVLAMLPHSLRAELNTLAQGMPVAAVAIDLDEEELTVDTAVLAALTPALRAELEKLRRGEPVEGIALDLDGEFEQYGDPGPTR
jgi:hypothetical protein